MFDTSIIEAQWCRNFKDGTVRMMGHGDMPTER